MAQTIQDFEYFEYNPSWKAEYLVQRTAVEWHRNFPDQFGRNRGARRPGTLQYFAQYSLMYLLRRDYGIRSLTWLHLAAVDKDSRQRLKADEPLIRATPKPCRDNPDKTRGRVAKWETMRALMGSSFDTLQQAIVKAGFSGYTGEPDLFCYAEDKTWFFAEAKTARERFRPFAGDVVRDRGESSWRRMPNLPVSSRAGRGSAACIGASTHPDVDPYDRSKIAKYSRRTRWPLSRMTPGCLSCNCDA